MKHTILPDYAQQMNQLGSEARPFLFVLDFELQQPLVLPLDSIDCSKVLYAIHQQKNYTPPFLLAKKIHFKKQPIPFAVYKKGFDKVLEHINYGNSYLVNLTFPTPIESNLSLKEIFYKSQAKYKLWLNDQFVVFSPESFVQIRQGKIASFPMKGTIDADIPNAEALLMANAKELAEHHTIVDLIRNDLNLVAKKIYVDRFRYIDKITSHQKNLLQVSSEIVGDLPTNYAQQIGTIIHKLLPAGSISGAPKKKTIDIIKESEVDKRGYYTGIMGVFDGINMDSGVMIRFIEQQAKNLFFRSGGGITTHSDPKTEYQELIDKIYVPITGNYTNTKQDDLQFACS